MVPGVLDGPRAVDAQLVGVENAEVSLDSGGVAGVEVELGGAACDLHFAAVVAPNRTAVEAGGSDEFDNGAVDRFDHSQVIVVVAGLEAQRAAIGTNKAGVDEAEEPTRRIDPQGVRRSPRRSCRR